MNEQALEAEISKAVLRREYRFDFKRLCKLNLIVLKAEMDVAQHLEYMQKKYANIIGDEREDADPAIIPAMFDGKVSGEKTATLKPHPPIPTQGERE